MQQFDDQALPSALNANSVAFIGLCKEYCETLERVSGTQDVPGFIDAMVHLLPRLYISATDLRVDDTLADVAYLSSFLDEDYYDAVRRSVETLLGSEDVYLEVFEEDMKYSDTPVSASISEGLSDIFQVLFNFLGMIQGGDVTDETLATALVAVREDFRSYWSGILCNVLRAVNRLASDNMASEY